MASRIYSKYMPTSDEFPIYFLGLLKVAKDGRCERLTGNDIVPAGTDPQTGVRSKDVVLSKQYPDVFVRIYVPNSIIPSRKLPTLIYYHGGGFVCESAASSTYHPTLNLVTSESNVVVVSVNYRLAPEHLIPSAYEDSWEATKWVASHGSGNGPESWLTEHADFRKVFFGGDSAGANISHNMAMRVGLSPINGINLVGMILLHPYFGGTESIGVECKKPDAKVFHSQGWKFVCPSWIGLDDPLFNPGMDPWLASLGCSRILVCVGEKDNLRDRGLNYKKVMEKSGWQGRVELMVNEGEAHGFFLTNTSCENACLLRKRICTFINPILSKV